MTGNGKVSYVFSSESQLFDFHIPFFFLGGGEVLTWPRRFTLLKNFISYSYMFSSFYAISIFFFSAVPIILHYMTYFMIFCFYLQSFHFYICFHSLIIISFQSFSVSSIVSLIHFFFHSTNNTFSLSSLFSTFFFSNTTKVLP